MIRFTATIEKFAEQGEKTGWSYITVSSERAQKLVPGNKKSFRIKGTLDDHAFAQVSLIPMGEGNFIMVLKASLRKAIRKQKGATVKVVMEVDREEIRPPEALMECFNDEPEARKRYEALPKGHQNYYTFWINEAKTEPTKAKRIAATINSLLKGWDFGEMIRAMKRDKEERK